VSVVLLFDEADGLFGQRVGVRVADDRYANLEAADLPQQLEPIQGACFSPPI